MLDMFSSYIDWDKKVTQKYDAVFEEEFTILSEKIEATVHRCPIKKTILKKL